MALSKDYILQKFSKPTAIGICGVATAGKDTFFALLQEYLGKYGLDVRRYALADKLKDEMDPFLTQNTGISAWTKDPASKTLIRPLLVSYGGIKRRQSQGTYWTKQIEQPLRDALAKGIIPVVTDIRYAEYDKDEVHWIRDFGGKLAYITRYQLRDVVINETYMGKTKVFVEPPNEDERRNDPNLRKAATSIIEWDTYPQPTLENLGQHIEEFIIAL